MDDRRKECLMENTDSKQKHSKKLLNFLSLLWESKTGLVGLILVFIVIITAIFAPWIATHDPILADTSNMNKPPFWISGGDTSHLLGTDNLGRDLFSRVIYGSRISLLVGVSSVIIAGTIGMAVALVAGYYGGVVDNILMRVVDAFLAIPGILLVLVFLAVLKPGIVTLIFIIGITTWVTYARVIRGDVLVVKEQEYVKAAISMGVIH